MELKIYRRAAEVSRFQKLSRNKATQNAKFLASCPVASIARQRRKVSSWLQRSTWLDRRITRATSVWGTIPHLRVFQLYTLPQFRGRQIGRKLIDALASEAESQYCISISARVAADLHANEFWNAWALGRFALRGAASRPGAR